MKRKNYISEDNYIRLMQQGDEKAFLYFLEKDGWIVKSLIRKKMVYCPEEQEDCMNEVFLAIWQNVRTYSPHKSSFPTWVAAVTRYQIFNYLRYMQKNSSRYQKESLDELKVANECRELNEYYDKEVFRELLQDLDERDQRIFTKLFQEQLSYEEICEDMKISREQLYNYISRGKKKLRKKLTEGGK